MSAFTTLSVPASLASSRITKRPAPEQLLNLHPTRTRSDSADDHAIETHGPEALGQRCHGNADHLVPYDLTKGSQLSRLIHIAQICQPSTAISQLAQFVLPEKTKKQRKSYQMVSGSYQSARAGWVLDQLLSTSIPRFSFLLCVKRIH